MKDIKSRHNYNDTVNYIKSLSGSICSIISSNHPSQTIYRDFFYGDTFTFYYLQNARKTYNVSPSLTTKGSYTISENNNIKRFDVLHIVVSKQLFSVKIRITRGIHAGFTEDENDVYDFLLRQGI